MDDTAEDLGVRFELGDDGVAVLTLNRPERGNAIAPPQRDRIIELLERSHHDSSVRAVVLTGTGDRHFCTGGDLKHPIASFPEGAPPRPVGDIWKLIQAGIQKMMTAIMDCEKPVIAAVNGVAAGIGSHLALSCDLVIASERASFMELFVRRGLVPDGAGAYLLTRLVGPQIAKELLFFGDAIEASEAHRLGLVNRVVPHDEVLPLARAWAERLAGGPTVMLGLTKSLVNRAMDYDRETALRAEATSIELNSRSHDFGEGQRAFLEKRPVRFLGC